MTPPVSAHLRIEGRVQGVWYQGWTVDQATDLGLRGWIRNRRDGSVEALAVGSPSAIDKLERRCRHGPALAQVRKIVRTTAPDDGSAGFRQRRTV